MTGPPSAVAAVRSAVRPTLAGLDPGALVLVACSGGADSLALAAATAFEAPRVGLRAGAVTVDHGLQAGSEARAAEVAAVCRRLRMDPVEIETVTVDATAGGGPEAAARAARYAGLDAAALRLGADAVLLGHTRDDQAETVLLGLARGSGARSLAGMASSAGRYRRPLLGLPRRVTRDACTAESLEPWDDPHNADPSYTRVRVRRDVLPVMEEALGPGVAEALARTARLLRDDADALDEWAERALADCRRPQGGMDAATLGALPPAVRRRVLRLAAMAAGAPRGALTAAHLEALDGLVTRWRGQGPVSLPGRVEGSRRYGTLVVARDEGR